MSELISALGIIAIFAIAAWAMLNDDEDLG